MLAAGMLVDADNPPAAHRTTSDPTQKGHSVKAEKPTQGEALSGAQPASVPPTPASLHFPLVGHEAGDCLFLQLLHRRGSEKPSPLSTRHCPCWVAPFLSLSPWNRAQRAARCTVGTHTRKADLSVTGQAQRPWHLTYHSWDTGQSSTSKEVGSREAVASLRSSLSFPLTEIKHVRPIRH